MSGLTFDLTGAEDDASISDLLAQSDLPGWISLSYRSSPGAHGMLHPQAVSQTLVGRGAGGLAGMVTRSTYPGFLAGHVQDLSYLGHFRVAPFARRRLKLLRQAFDAFHDRFGAGWSFASLVDDNIPAKRLLTSGLPGFPRFVPVGQFKTVVLRSLKPAKMVMVRTALPKDMPQVAAFHHALARSLAPVLTAEDLAQDRWLGLAPQDVLIAERAGKLVGFVALWDQRHFRQIRVTSYRRPLSALRGLVNLLGPLTGCPHLPDVGKDLALGYLSFLSVQPGDHDTALRLVEAARRLAGARGLQSVALGLGADDPLLHRLRPRAATYGSCIYTVSWQDGAAPPPSDFIGMQPDIGLL
jgi:hypothetical protein